MEQFYKRGYLIKYTFAIHLHMADMEHPGAHVLTLSIRCISVKFIEETTSRCSEVCN